MKSDKYIKKLYGRNGRFELNIIIINTTRKILSPTYIFFRHSKTTNPKYKKYDV